MLHAIRDVRGVRRAFIDRLGELPQILIEIDRAAAARYGLNVADIEDVIETALGGAAGDADLGGRAALRRGGAAQGCGAHAHQLQDILVSDARRAPTFRCRRSPNSALSAAA